jgi:hypothetical protein
MVCAAATIAALLAATVGAADARDRPGTPNGVYANVCTNDMTHAKRVCAYFTNTAHEDVRIEWQSTRNGAPASLNAEYCAPDAKQLTRIRCFTAVSGTLQAQSTSNGPFNEFKQYGPNLTYGLMTADVDFGATYCMRFRARRVSDQVVSEVWSAWGCVTTPPLPPKPAAPKFEVTYHGSQTAPRAGNAAGPPPVPETMQIAPVADASVAEYDLKVSEVGSSLSPYSDVRLNSGELTPFVYKIDPAVQAVSVQLCAVNFSGKTCASQLQSISGEGSISLPVRSVLPVPTSQSRTGLPIRLTGKASTVALSPQEFMVGSDLPGSDYQHEPTSGVAEDCRKRCDADGNCLAWTWVKPGVQNSLAMCWLKNAVPPSVKNENATSGIKQGSTIVR